MEREKQELQDFIEKDNKAMKDKLSKEEAERERKEKEMAVIIYFFFNMRGKYQTGKIHKWVLEIQKTYLAKNLGKMGRTSDPMGQTSEMDTWATRLG